MKTIERTPSGFSGPTLDTSMITPSGQHARVVRSHSMLKGLTIVNNEYILVAAMLEQETNNWGMDLFTLAGNYQKSIPVAQFPLPFWYRYSTADSKGNVYFDLATQSDPVIVKYHVTL